MSDQITQHYVDQFNSNVWHLSQQKGSRLQPAVRNEMQKGESEFWDRYGAVDAQKKLGRNEDVNYSNTPHSRRKVTTQPYYYADLVDKQDKIKMLNSPESEYTKAAVMALGRGKDDEVILAALGNAYGGQTGADVIALPTSQKLAAHDGSTTSGVNLNVKTLRAIKQKFDANEVDEEMPRFMAITSFQLQSLLAQTEVTNADYASVKALVQGQVDSFMGFKFIRLERLARSSSNVTYTVTDGTVGAGTGTVTASKSRRCFAWAQDGLLLSTAEELQAKLDVIPTKHHSVQVYASLNIGATRMEEVKVVEVICSE